MATDSSTSYQLLGHIHISSKTQTVTACRGNQSLAQLWWSVEGTAANNIKIVQHVFTNAHCAMQSYGQIVTAAHICLYCKNRIVQNCLGPWLKPYLAKIACWALIDRLIRMLTLCSAHPENTNPQIYVCRYLNSIYIYIYICRCIYIYIYIPEGYTHTGQSQNSWQHSH
jgi:hypothetical protein